MTEDSLRWSRGDRADAGHDLADQLQLAAELGRPDASRRPVRDTTSQINPSCSPRSCRRQLSPVTIPAALAQQLAEALSGIALSQLIRPGCPVIFGSFLSTSTSVVRLALLWHTGVGNRAFVHRTAGQDGRTAVSYRGWSLPPAKAPMPRPVTRLARRCTRHFLPV